MEDWLAANLPEGARVGIDPWLHTVDAVRRLNRKLTESGKSVMPLSTNPVDTVWAAERPPLPDAPLRVHALEWAGADVASKLVKLRKQVRRGGVACQACIGESPSEESIRERTACSEPQAP